jgi:light-regulated signal transduction histidine kinase (bacteriophytochrome)
VFQLEYRVLKANGTLGWTSSRAVPIINRDGELVEWFGAASDITEKKNLLEQLEEKVEERTMALQRSNDDLQQFAHVASHDLKEPVRKIRTFGLRLREELNGLANENCKKYNEKILESASRMFTMIEGVLTYSSLTAVERKIEKLDLNKVLSDIRTDLEILVEQKNAEIQYGLLPEVDGVQVLIYQLFYNLINNSLKFSKPNEKTLITVTANKVSFHNTPCVRIAVADNGIGFEPEYNETIFNMFTRLHSKHKYDGTGLGLSLVKKIVERHHGTIEASGHKDRGAVFTIVLPVKQHGN